MADALEEISSRVERDLERFRDYVESSATNGGTDIGARAATPSVEQYGTSGKSGL